MIKDINRKLEFEIDWIGTGPGKECSVHLREEKTLCLAPHLTREEALTLRDKLDALDYEDQIIPCVNAFMMNKILAEKKG